MSEKKIDVLILNAKIVDVEAGDIYENRLIGVSGDTIEIVDFMSNSDIYDSEEIVNVDGDFVMPGLWDMHVHFRGGDSLIDENKNLLPLFLAYGVTTVRAAGGDISNSIIEWRTQMTNNLLEGPTIFMFGPMIDGNGKHWPGALEVYDSLSIENTLDSLQKLGVDYVKVYNSSLTEENYYNLIKQTKMRPENRRTYTPFCGYNESCFIRA